MPLVRQAIPSFYGGISHQSASIRATNQCESAENCYFSVAYGASKRPPVELLNLLFDVPSSEETPPIPIKDRFFSHIPWPGHVGFLLEIPGDGSYRVFDLRDGSVVSTDNDSGQAYLTVAEGARAAAVFRTQTVNTRVYVVNTTVTVALSEDNTPGQVGGTAQTLQDTVLDGAGEGAIYRILGDEANPTDTYYAKKTAGRWVEWVQPGIPFQFDAATMPHRVEMTEADDTLEITFATADWGMRLVGDTRSNKQPTFVDRKLSGVFFAHNRMGFLAANAVILSETGEWANFWRTTVTTLLDTDRVDTQVSGDGSSHLHFARPLGKSTILFADDRQFSLDGSPYMSPKNVAITQATVYPASRVCAPVNAGSNVYFASNGVTTSSVWEMFVQEDTVTNSAANTTSHVPGLLTEPVAQLVAHPEVDFLGCRLDASSKLFVYQTFWAGDEKVQASWNPWVLPGGLVWRHVFVAGEYLYVVASYAGTNEQAFLGRINLRLGATSPEMAWEGKAPVNLDMLSLVTGTYNVTTGRTTFPVAFPAWSPTFQPLVRLVESSGATHGRVYRLSASGAVPFYQGADTYQVDVIGDWSERPLFIGLNYAQRMTLSEQFWYDGERAALVARLQIRNIAVAFRDTAYFRVEVKVLGAPESIHEVVTGLTGTYTARTVGNEDFQLNRPQLASSRYRFPVLGQSRDVRISLINDEYTPSHFVNAEWEGLVTTRTKR